MGSQRRGMMVAARRAFMWVRRKPKTVQICMAVALAVIALVALKFIVTDPMYFFALSVSSHCAGILILIYKLGRQQTCSGLSLKTQELTAISIATRLGSSYILGRDSFALLYLATLASTLWVIYMIRIKLKATYKKELDIVPLSYLIVPCVILGILIHPHHVFRGSVFSMFWAFSLYLDAVSVFPQLRVIQNTKMIEPFTAHYVFALGVARFFTFAHWVIQLYESVGHYWYLVEAGYIWLPAFFIAELVHTFILADFCYYYVKSVLDGQLIVSIPPV